MRNLSRILLLLAATSLFGFILVGQSKSQTPSLHDSTHWEYQILQNPGNVVRLSQLGSKGWELVTIYERVPGVIRGVFKRLK